MKIVRAFVHLSPIFVALLCGSPAIASTLTLQKFASGGDSIQVTAPPGDTEHVFVLDRLNGTVTVRDRITGVAAPTPFLTLPSSSFAADFVNSAFSIAFSPDYAQSGKVYVSYVDKLDNLQVVEATADANDKTRVDATTFRSVLNVKYDPVGPGTHYGADLDFGPDGFLYVTTGDSDESFENVKSQDLASLQGKILRIDPRADAFPSDDVNNFAPASGNPFTAGGETKITDAIWSTGVRNPFQGSFDPATGIYFFGDVGEDLSEEINVGIAGGNYGWPGREGLQVFRADHLAGSPTLTDPIYTYLHGLGDFEGFSVVGGLVYHGPVAGLEGRYFFADFISAKIWSFNYDLQNSGITNLIFWSLNLPADVDFKNILSFGTDGMGDLYIVTLLDGIYKVTSAEVDEVPLPASGLLMLGGLGGLAAARRLKRRKA